MCPLEIKNVDQIKLRVWERMELEFNRNEQTGIYSARIEDLRSEGIVFDRPLWLTGEPLFNAKESFLATIFRDDSAYQFRSAIIGTLTERDRPLYIAKYPDRIFRHQRRNFCRVEVCFAIRFKLLEEVLRGHDSYMEAKEYSGTARNISASGILINTLKVLKTGNPIALNLCNSEIGFDFPIFGITRRIQDAEENRINAGIEFIVAEKAHKFLKQQEKNCLPPDLFVFTEKKRQNLSKFVFDYQVKLRQKGLI